MNKIDKFMKFLNIINSGHELDIDGNTILVGYVDNDIPKIGVKFTKIDSHNNEKEVILEPPLIQDLNNFIDYVDKHLSENELNVGLMNLTLNKVLKNK